MKALLIGLLLAGAQAFACPNLSGTYTCNYDGQVEQVVMSQTVTDGVTVYTIGGDSLPANNVTYRLQDSAEFKNGTIRGWCEGEYFRVGQTGQIFDQNQHVGDLEAIITFGLQGQDLMQITEGVFKTGSGDYPINGQLVCQRVN